MYSYLEESENKSKNKNKNESISWDNACDNSIWNNSISEKLNPYKKLIPLDSTPKDEKDILIENQKQEIRTLKSIIQKMQGEIINFDVDAIKKDEEIRILKVRLNESKNGKDKNNKFGFITNVYSIREAVFHLNCGTNKEISKEFNELVVYSVRAKNYFTCIKKYDGKWIEGVLYLNPVENMRMINLNVRY